MNVWGISARAISAPPASLLASPSATVSGTTAFTEAQIVTGGDVTTITLTGDTWVAAGATFNAQRQNIINGFDSAQSEATGWNAEVRDKEVVTAVVRTSDTVVTITWTAAPAYDVTADETITVTIPATAVTGAAEITGSPTITVEAEAEAEAGSGGYSLWVQYEQEQLRKEEEERERRRKLAEAENIQNELDRALALAQRNLEKEQAERGALERLTEMVRLKQSEIESLENERITLAAEEAIAKQTFSAMERLDRELKRFREEEEFMLMAMAVLLNE